MLLAPAAYAVIAYVLASRLAYVLFVGIALRRQERAAVFTRDAGVARGFRRFRRIAAAVMYNDAAAFILLCYVTRDTLAAPVPRSVAVGAGLALALIGLGIKLWAARTLGADAYYWYNFFEPAPAGSRTPVSAGPYRFASNPMYTIGYLQTYGLALILASWPGLLAAVFAHAAILVFYVVVEKPHFERLHRS
ncbi:MAG: PEMT/PEM2 family methyltransferase [Gemmatimonadales bacterium]